MSEQTTSNDSATTETATAAPVEPKPSSRTWTRKQLAGLILILLGVIFFLDNIGLFWWWDWDTTWPLILMGIGLIFLVSNARTKQGQGRDE